MEITVFNEINMTPGLVADKIMAVNAINHLRKIMLATTVLLPLWEVHATFQRLNIEFGLNKKINYFYQMPKGTALIMNIFLDNTRSFLTAMEIYFIVEWSQKISSNLKTIFRLIYVCSNFEALLWDLGNYKDTISVAKLGSEFRHILLM